MPMLQAGAIDGVSGEPGRLLHPGNAILRRAIQENVVSFPSQIPVFSRQARPEMQWKAVLLYFVRGWPLSDIAARFGVAPHRIAQVVNEWATRALALGYIQVIDPERFTTWSRAQSTGDESSVQALELRAPLIAVSRSFLARVSEERRGEKGGTGWRPSRSPQAAGAGLVTALDVAIGGCEHKRGEFWSRAATMLRGLRSAIEAGESLRPADPASRTSDANKLSPAPQAPAEELLYAFKS
jgi:hypothetical protein